ncbi:hypothetical protein L9F63_024849 [Diploptera punctata]|uniref:Uncharacterized protein n=1 Tax=Diploptera punctata TaxID=6984 RepID=A0AAD7ZET3_DIPPU|nr:hypothetical protein L9F63_024849 [Diploptera punctata]
MTLSTENASLSTSIFDLVWHYICEFSELLLSTIGLTSGFQVESSWPVHFMNSYSSVINWLAFDDFQIKLLKGFLFILCANLFLIYVSWKIYGKRISEKFMRPGS